MDWNSIIPLIVIGILAIERIVNRKPYKLMKQIQVEVIKTKDILAMRKEENSICMDASEAAVDAAIAMGGNGECHDAKRRIVAYRNKCIEHRL